jgi:flagellar hook-length control protein FliK
MRDDDTALDAFTALLLSAATLQDEAAANDASIDAHATPGKPAGDAAAEDAADVQPLDAAALLGLPLAQLGNVAAGTVPPGAARATDTVRRMSADAGASSRLAALGSAKGGAAAQVAAMAAPVPSPEAGSDAPTRLPIDAATLGADSGSDAARPTGRWTLPAGASNTAARDGAAMVHEASAPSISELAALAAMDAREHAAPAASHADGGKLGESLAAPLSALHGAAAPVAPAIHVETINAPAFAPGWQDEAVAKLAHIVLGRQDRAELKLNPAELGPVSIRLDVQADQASVNIVASSPETRSALEQSLPQLRDLLASQGITLAQASVHDGGSQRDPSHAFAAPASRDVREPVPGTTSTVAAVPLRRVHHLVDLFA